jgi:hypothetical protein
VKGYTELLDQLSQTIANHNLQIDSLTPPLSLLSASLHQKEAELDVKAKVLDTHDLKLSKYEQYISHWRDRLLYPSTYHHVMQVDRLTRIFIHATDVIRQQHCLDTPYSAFILHRRITPALAQLSSSLCKYHKLAPSIQTDDRAVEYYKKCVHNIQYDLKDNKWNDFKDIQMAYKLTALPSNPGIKHESDGE